MKKVISKKVLALLSLLLFLSVFSGCFLTPSVNQTPTITSTPITTATVDEPYTYNVNATDPDGDTLTYSLTTHPSGMTVNSATGLINWTPTSAQIGDHNVTVEVSDGELSDNQSFVIEVIEAEGPGYTPTPGINHAPTITSTPITTVTVDDLYVYDVNATDPDGNTLTYSLTANPTGMTINSATGLINWTPTFVQIGDHNVTVKVSDGSLNDAQPFTITVHDVLDHIVVLPVTMTLFEGGETESIASITAHYNNGATANIALAACSYNSNAVGVATVAIGVVTTVADGAATITVTYIEGGITKTDTVVVTVNPILLTSITVLPATMTLFVGEEGTITSIMASYNHGSDQSKTLAQCTYGSNDETKATVAVGVVTGVSAGSATITVSYLEGGITMTDTVAVTVNAIELTSITVSPATMTLFVGETGTVTSIMASYNYGDDVSIDLDDAACTYSSDNESAATVAVGVVTTVAEGTATITVTYIEGGITKTDTVVVTVEAIVLDHIVVLPETMDLFVTVIGAGETESIASITAHYNDASTANLALGDCTYGSDNESVATVAVGVVTAVGAGTATITVTYIEGGITKTDTVGVTVDSANLELIPPTQSVAVGNPVTINILVENVTDLMGVNITLNFDATKLQHVSSTAGSFFSLAFVIPTVDNVNGSVTLVLATLAEKPSGTGNIITIVFNTVATGVADITFGATILRDKNNISIIHTSGSGCSVNIN